VLYQLREALAKETCPRKRYELQQRLDELLWCDACGSSHDETVACDSHEGKPWTAADRAAEEQRQAAEWAGSIFNPNRPRCLKATRPRVRGGRTVRPRPAPRRSPGRVRGSPGSDDPEPESKPAAATLVRSAAAGIVAYTRSRRDAITLSRVVKAAILRDGRLPRG
jgi:hypothetical protein